MNELVIQGGNGQDVTTSQIVAQVFGKRHSDVLRDVRNLKCSDDFRKRNFALMVEMKELPQGGAQKSEFYEMTKDGFSFLVMGYTGAKAGQFKEQFIAEFNKREMMLKSDDYILMRSQQILQKRIELAEQKVKQARGRQRDQAPAHRAADGDHRAAERHHQGAGSQGKLLRPDAPVGQHTHHNAGRKGNRARRIEGSTGR